MHFMLSREGDCVQFSSQFMEYKNGGKSFGDFFMLREKQEGSGGYKIRGLISISVFGNLTHCIPEVSAKDSGWKKVLKPFLRQRKITSITGEKAANILLEKSCPGFFSARKKYLLMKNNAGTDGNRMNSLRRRDRRFRIIECGQNHAGQLLPLQENYEAEELGVAVTEKNRAKILLKLKYTLRNQIVLGCAAGNPSRLLGKAATNAKGFNWYQIGGVYTRTEFRNKGIANFLISGLVKRIHSENKGAVLFVRSKNKAAIRVYKNNGFTECGFFRAAEKVF